MIIIDVGILSFYQIWKSKKEYYDLFSDHDHYKGALYRNGRRRGLACV